MNVLLIMLPFAVSFLLGYLLIDLIFGPNSGKDPWTKAFLAGGLGLGTSSYVAFTSLIFLGEFVPAYCIIAHLGILTLLLYHKILKIKPHALPAFNPQTLYGKNAVCLAVLVAALIPSWLQGSFFPYGGWDAWSVWNFKAKFILLGGAHWKNIFDPILWRSSPHYPLLLPLINAWGWAFIKRPIPVGPAITTILFLFFAAGLLFSALKRHTKITTAILAPLLLLTLPFYANLASSQYCDLILGYFLLASLYCFTEAMENGEHASMLLCGVFTGFLSFSKPEGLLAAMLLSGLILALFASWTRKKRWGPRRSSLKYFLSALVLAGMPTVILQFFYSPGNQTFINGLTSADHPVTLYRIKMIMAFLIVELKSGKWNGVWLVLILGMLFSGRRCFSKKIIIVPTFLLFYIAGILSFYVINTYFEIAWWLQVSLNRILFSLLPIMLFWIFSCFREGPQRPS